MVLFVCWCFLSAGIVRWCFYLLACLFAGVFVGRCFSAAFVGWCFCLLVTFFCLSISLFLYLDLPTYLSIWLYIYLSFSLSVSISIYLYRTLLIPTCQFLRYSLQNVQWCALLQVLTSESGPLPSIFCDLDLPAPQGRALFHSLNFKTRRGPVILCNVHFPMCFAPQQCGTFSQSKNVQKRRSAFSFLRF